MARDVKWTAAAASDLEQIAEYIAKDSRYYAGAFAREVRDAARSLAQLAARGHIVPEFGDPNLREIFVKRYRLLYQVTDQTVFIIGLIHSARDLLAHWEEQERNPTT